MVDNDIYKCYIHVNFLILRSRGRTIQ